MYRITYCKNGKYQKIDVFSESEMLEEVADKLVLCDKVTVKVLR